MSRPLSTLHQPSWVTYPLDGRRVLTSGGDATDALWDGVTAEPAALVGTPERFTVAGFGANTESVLTVGEFGRPGLHGAGMG